MGPQRRALLGGARRALLAATGLVPLLGLAPMAAGAEPVRRGRALVFPRDHGAHPDAAIEWWYATGWLGAFDAPTHGFQVTFFRSRTPIDAAGSTSRYAPRQILFAHAALTDLAARTHRHAERIARWDGRRLEAPAFAAEDDARVRIGAWTWQREDGPPVRWRARLPGDPALDVTLARTQPVLLQGDAGWSRKGPAEVQASHYYSEPQLAAEVQTGTGAQAVRRGGRAWLDHEWSDVLMHPEAVGWDWIGINLADGGALTAFRLRRADGTALWAGGSLRDGRGSLTVFGAADVTYAASGRAWTSPATQARYPVQWTVTTPAGRWQVAALLDAQEIDARGSTGTIYWEGLAELRDERGQRVGLGYLEMTGYAERLRLGA
ncbi:MAG: carotenoid 1,2-hydratase [Rubrivivax sp.]|jgi:predicted secreted hydrolase|nr:carotenoid 1,2-hydratase [Rubrivivax sp.]